MSHLRTTIDAEHAEHADPTGQIPSGCTPYARAISLMPVRSTAHSLGRVQSIATTRDHLVDLSRIIDHFSTSPFVSIHLSVGSNFRRNRLVESIQVAQSIVERVLPGDGLFDFCVSSLPAICLTPVQMAMEHCVFRVVAPPLQIVPQPVHTVLNFGDEVSHLRLRPSAERTPGHCGQSDQCETTSATVLRMVRYMSIPLVVKVADSASETASLLEPSVESVAGCRVGFASLNDRSRSG